MVAVNSMFNKIELYGIVASVFIMAFGLYLYQARSILFGELPTVVSSESRQPVVVASSQMANLQQARADAYLQATGSSGNIERMIIDDIKIGTGPEVERGDVVAVHYIGTLQNGDEFDNSRRRGQPFSFKVGAGEVIEGWEEGVVGMKVGGQRILIIPPALAYGDKGIGPIPGGATLVFSIELIEIK